jgi:hypothetical protein
MLRFSDLSGYHGVDASRGQPMTEAEWLTATDPTPMLEFIRSKASDRKLRLFAVAYYRKLSHMPDCNENIRKILDVTERSVEVAELYADRLATDDEFYAAIASINMIGEIRNFSAAYVTPPNTRVVCEAPPVPSGEDWEEGQRGKKLVLLHDICGNPFRPVALNSSWLTSTVLALASGIYEERAFDRMPILADALQDAGCDNEEILNHCRQPGEHCRGCWVVDLILSKC